MAHKSVKKNKIRQKYCLNEENDLNLREIINIKQITINKHVKILSR